MYHSVFVAIFITKEINSHPLNIYSEISSLALYVENNIRLLNLEVKGTFYQSSSFPAQSPRKSPDTTRAVSCPSCQHTEECVPQVPFITTTFLVLTLGFHKPRCKPLCRWTDWQRHLYKFIISHALTPVSLALDEEACLLGSIFPLWSELSLAAPQPLHHRRLYTW